jgi:surface protein
VDGDSVTFGFKSDYSGVGDGYGYYAVITADVTPGVTPGVTSEAYAVFDSSDGSFTFFRDDKGKYTNGQVSGTKTYYTGFEDITGETDPSWYNSDGYEQKNTIKTVVFKDKIKPKTCYDWFAYADALTSITGLDKLDTSAVTDMNGMFQNCSSLTSLDLSSFDTENVTNMGYMFYNCSSLTSLDVSSFNTAKVTDMGDMFYYCRKLKTIYASSLFTTNAVSSSNSMFAGCTSLVGGAGTTYDASQSYTINKTYARIDGGTSNPGYFTAK